MNYSRQLHDSSYILHDRTAYLQIKSNKINTNIIDRYFFNKYNQPVNCRRYLTIAIYLATSYQIHFFYAQKKAQASTKRGVRTTDYQQQSNKTSNRLSEKSNRSGKNKQKANQISKLNHRITKRGKKETKATNSAKKT